MKQKWKRVVCFLLGHDWDLAYHGPGGSGFVCCRCPAEQHSGDKKIHEVPWAGYLARRKWRKSLKNAKPIKISDIDDMFPRDT